MGRHRTAQEKVELAERARALRAAGRSRREIRAELGVGDDLLTELLAGSEVPESLRRPRAKDDLRALARELYRGGRSYREIERELGVARSSLSLWLRDLRADAGQLELPEVEVAQEPSRQDVARELRAQGLLLREIAARLGVSSVTVHRWVCDLPVPARARPGGDAAHMHRMRRKYWDAELAERERARQQVQATAAAAVAPLTPAVLLLVASIAYWYEGTKSKPWARREHLQFINSDPGLILLFLAYLRQEGVADDRLSLAVSIHESGDVDAAEEYWAHVTGVSRAQFRPPWLKRHNPKTVRKNTGEGYVGCLCISVRQSRVLYQRLVGTWQGMMNEVARTDGTAA